MKLNKGQCKVLQLGKKNPWQQECLTANSSGEQTLCVVADRELSMTAACPGKKEGQQHPDLY